MIFISRRECTNPKPLGFSKTQRLLGTVADNQIGVSAWRGVGTPSSHSSSSASKSCLFLKGIAVGRSVLGGRKRGPGGLAFCASVRHAQNAVFWCPSIPGRCGQNERTRIQSQTVYKRKKLFFCRESPRDAEKVFFSNRSASPCPGKKNMRFGGPIPQRCGSRIAIFTRVAISLAVHVSATS